MITIIRGCVACYVFLESGNLNFWQFLKHFRTWPWKKKSTVLDEFFPYLAQMITSMRGCVAYNDPWPWLLSSRSFGLGLENHVRSVASTVPDEWFPYLVQMITSMRKCVACDDLWPWHISSRSFGLDLENGVRSLTSTVLDGFFYIRHKWSLSLEGVSRVIFFQYLEIWIFCNLKKNFGLDLEKKICSSGWILSIFGTNDH